MEYARIYSYVSYPFAPEENTRAVPTSQSLFRPSTIAMLSLANKTYRRKHMNHIRGTPSIIKPSMRRTFPEETLSSSSFLRASSWLGLRVLFLKIDISASQSGSSSDALHLIDPKYLRDEARCSATCSLWCIGRHVPGRLENLEDIILSIISYIIHIHSIDISSEWGVIFVR